MTKVAVLYGGNTGEREISIKSANAIYNWLDGGRFNPVLVCLDDGHFSEDISTFDIVYNTIHGSPGENGLVQGYLELIGVKHTSSPVMASSITYSKFDTSKFISASAILDLNVAKSLLVRKSSKVKMKQVSNIIGFPCFVKPNLGGSSLGASIVVGPDDLDKAIDNARVHCDEVVVEQYLKGREFTCGIVNSDILEVTEIEHGADFFDYETKYSGRAKEITPPQLDLSTLSKIKRITSDVYDVLRCKGIARVDYIMTPDKELYLLEVNTTPGMTDASIIPQQVKATGRTMREVLEKVIDFELQN